MPVITPTPYTKLDKEVEKPEVVLFYLGLFPVMLSPEVAAELMEGKPLPEGTCREVREYTPFEYDSCLKY